MATKTGLWIIGARGSVATTVQVGLAALQSRTLATTGLVTELPLFAGLPLLDWGDLVVGGHEATPGTTLDAARALQAQRVLTAEQVDAVADDLRAADDRIRPGVLYRSGTAIDAMGASGYATTHTTPRAAIEAIQADLTIFKQEHDLANVIVVLLASTEPPTPTETLPQRWAELEPLLDQPESCPLRASSLYAIAALDLGLPFVNFTPSLGSACAAIEELAIERKTCHAGRDGKTGETLLKTVLAPMFAARNLEVMSWVGHNLLGNADGAILAADENKQSKVESKDQSLAETLGYMPQSHVSIEPIHSLGDWKTAWDHVHFRGFLNIPMTLQFTWQGCDSALAAPLVLDLVRLTEHASRVKMTGTLTPLASFFKSPLGRAPQGFFEQFQLLAQHVAEHSNR